MKFEYYVLNYDCNRKEIYQFNVFQNCRVQEWSEKAVKKYLRSPSKYKYVRQYSNPMLGTEEIVAYGFEGLCAEIRSILMNQLWSRREYEVCVTDAFTYEICDIVKDLDKYDNLEDLKQKLIDVERRNARLEKWDCYQQCELNIPMITRDIIWQYKQQIKEEKS